MAAAAPTDVATVKDGAFADRDGVLVVRAGERFVPANLSESVAGRVRGMLGVRDAVRVVFQTQLDDCSLGEIDGPGSQMKATCRSYEPTTEQWLRSQIVPAL